MPEISSSIRLATIANGSHDLSADLQQAIQRGDAKSVSLLSRGVAMNLPLPNGELPLHFAVRENKQDMVSILLKGGADPEIKDFQNLSAIDHTILMSNTPMLAAILSQKIGRDLEEVQQQVACKGSAFHVHQLKNKIETISSVSPEKLSFMHRAAYEGNVEVFSNRAAVLELINDYDENGLSPLHYAILGNRKAMIDQLARSGAKVNTLNRDGDSILHFAAIHGSSDLLEKIMKLGVSPNLKNNEGFTPLHYASAKEDITAVETLVKNGANPHILDNEGMSSLALFGASAFEKDPLSLSKSQIVMFSMSSLFWLSYIGLASGAVGVKQADNVVFLGLLAAGVASLGQWTTLFTNLDKTWKKGLAVVGWLGLSKVAPLNIGFQGWKTYHVTQSAFDGLKNCWSNIGYRNWAVARNIVVHSTNTAHAIFSLYKSCEFGYEQYLRIPYIQRALNANSLEEQIEIELDFNRFIKERNGIYYPPVTVGACSEIDPENLANLSIIERALSGLLNPTCPEDALMMFCPTCTLDQLASEGAKLYGKAFRTASLALHPDKTKYQKQFSKEQCNRASDQLSAAKETLDQWVRTTGRPDLILMSMYRDLVT